MRALQGHFECECRRRRALRDTLRDIRDTLSVSAGAGTGAGRDTSGDTLRDIRDTLSVSAGAGVPTGTIHALRDTLRDIRDTYGWRRRRWRRRRWWDQSMCPCSVPDTLDTVCRMVWDVFFKNLKIN